ncbi:MAG: hypothetical protein OZ922_14455 [Myxococcales bacterium]|nr:hypothetical protein [Myxococcales bacterium]
MNRILFGLCVGIALSLPQFIRASCENPSCAQSCKINSRLCVTSSKSLYLNLVHGCEQLYGWGYATDKMLAKTACLGSCGQAKSDCTTTFKEYLANEAAAYKACLANAKQQFKGYIGNCKQATKECKAGCAGS